MTWQEEMSPMLRVLIDDTDEENPRYDDNQIERALVVAAHYVQLKISVGVYTISVSSSSISPDPYLNKDYGFMNLTVLKAACIIGTGEAKTKAGSSMSVKDDVSSIDTTGASKDSMQWAKDFCEAYKQAELEYRLGNSKSGQAIIGPHCTDRDYITTVVGSDSIRNRHYFN